MGGRVFVVSEPFKDTPDILFLNITASYLSVNCTANWSYGMGFSKNSGTAEMVIGDDTELSLRVAATNNTSTLGDNLELFLEDKLRASEINFQDLQESFVFKLVNCWMTPTVIYLKTSDPILNTQEHNLIEVILPYI